jgi:hypothetical protein
VKILLDENLDWRLSRDLPGHEVKSVPLIGWAGLKNGALLSKAETEFEVLMRRAVTFRYSLQSSFHNKRFVNQVRKHSLRARAPKRASRAVNQN